MQTTSIVPARPASTSLLPAAAVVVTFGAYGVAIGSPNTAIYLVGIVLLGALLLRVARAPLPGWLGTAIAVAAGLHLAGGLVPVGDDVLYNATAGGQLWRYDHLAHGFASFVGTVLAAHLLRRDGVTLPLAVWLLAGLGMGALNETIEFLSTMVQTSSHVGGYTNTGWDLVSNVVGCALALPVLRRTAAR
jgi:uncharacterized membrane protein YjdF